MQPMALAPEASAADWIIAVGTAFTALATVGLVIAAFVAWRTAKRALRASEMASSAAAEAARAARDSNDQARRSEIARSRPYVYVELLPSLAGESCYDLRIANSGVSSAQELWLESDSWPSELDDVAAKIKTLFETKRTLPPGCAIRAYWRLEGNFTDGTTEAGMLSEARIVVHYRADDPPDASYAEEFYVSSTRAGLWPVSESGPNPPAGMKGDARSFYKLGQALIRRVGDISR